jgi:uncharacterized small protein (DUF1192 family)
LWTALVADTLAVVRSRPIRHRNSLSSHEATMKNESEKEVGRVEISTTEPEQHTPSADKQVEKSDLSVNELEERIAPLYLQ